MGGNDKGESERDESPRPVSEIPVKGKRRARRRRKRMQANARPADTDSSPEKSRPARRSMPWPMRGEPQTLINKQTQEEGEESKHTTKHKQTIEDEELATF